MKDKNHVYVLILAGGKGERLWPKSRPSLPKQLQAIYSNKSLLKETLERAKLLAPLKNIYIGTNPQLAKTISKKEKGFPKSNFILEPEGRNTAPIIALATFQFHSMDPNSKVVVLSSDAFIQPKKEFQKTIQTALEHTEKSLVLLGIQPTRPEIGYGYIQIESSSSKSAFPVKKFHEKPSLDMAQQYIQKPDFFWNPGIFIFSAKQMLNELKTHATDVFEPLALLFSKAKGKVPFQKIAPVFKKLPSTPIDIAVMEKSKSILMCKASFGWDDVGSWTSLRRILPALPDGTVANGSEIFSYHSKNNIISSQKKLVALLGVEGLIVVDEGDVLFIANDQNIDQIKSMIAEIGKNKNLQRHIR